MHVLFSKGFLGRAEINDFISDTDNKLVMDLILKSFRYLVPIIRIVLIKLSTLF